MSPETSIKFYKDPGWPDEYSLFTLHPEYKHIYPFHNNFFQYTLASKTEFLLSLKSDHDRKRHGAEFIDHIIKPPFNFTFEEIQEAWENRVTVPPVKGTKINNFIITQ